MKPDCDNLRHQLAESATEANWQRWEVHANACDECAPAHALVENVERRGEAGIGDRRRAEVLAAAHFRCSHRPLLAPVLAGLAATVLAIGSIYLVCEVRSPEPVAAPTIVETEPEPVLVAPELPEDPFAAAFDSRVSDLRDRVRSERVPQRRVRAQEIRARVQKLRATLAIDS